MFLAHASTLIRVSVTLSKFYNLITCSISIPLYESNYLYCLNVHANNTVTRHTQIILNYEMGELCKHFPHKHFFCDHSANAFFRRFLCQQPIKPGSHLVVPVGTYQGSRLIVLLSCKSVDISLLFSTCRGRGSISKVEGH
jgi:hypothetical protein